ncbi:putative glutamine amidotransferase [Enterococcus sp. PF1-24]|uniref:gamma-glutamyl-gamma-aminobutyrate hydrolase family protein n=1 Tax=unclassified Enterococcus TaxID=2608891 RepID=UPI002474F67D|nr:MULTISPECIES: gamma-glutamyl-gamma-aminobutyrate hydrolase family protein [unclassified Enterococcus]MDH6365173.1 putative glutamine amidotransferase [Enterococcus sp. PFB1-1]MDH6402243.1 putative glutamine amidotransferase [Enterococcus sp. PF1-24]
MKKKIIGIAGNEIQDSGETLYHLPVSYVPNGYVKAVQKAGGLAFVLPIGEKVEAKDYISQIDKLILTGGQDISPKFYGQATSDLAGEGSVVRDEFELALIDEALLQNKPIFAVCRGMQLLNVAFGGTLLQDISYKSSIQHMQSPTPKEVPTHDIMLKESSLLAKIYGNVAKVNSFHHQAIDQLSSDFQKTAWSSDDIIEGIENQRQNLLGVQWHPDFAYDALQQEMDLFNYVVNSL